MTPLTGAEYADRRDRHRDAVGPFVADHAARRLAGQSHPVWDFLFQYYSFPPSHLLRYSQGLDCVIAGKFAGLDWADDYAPLEGGWALDPARFPARRIEYLEWAVGTLDAVGNREPHWGCHGLHEWAMVYQKPPRHTLPLRLTEAETWRVVESARLTCTHYDAFRFFSPEAVPLNRVALTRAGQPDHDQPGCVHVTMDLYKFAYKIAPFIASEVVGDAFGLACRARLLDMRASPYDLTTLGFTPVAIELAEGRECYRRMQRELAADAAPVRARVLAGYRALLAATNAGSILGRT